MNKSMITFALGMLFVNFAQASVAVISNESKYSDQCAAAIVDAVLVEDRKIDSFIGEGASATVSDHQFGAKIFVEVLVQEADYADGYTTWRVEVQGQSEACEIIHVELSDVAF